ncbi:uncharacterized protein PV07_12570 [Cladophialophora immunda]|uniref:AB hydrolase-1 domain-containing protein n=1 Tax=Cladophialophora immunda TaxID=569365 RepID=A0A0D2BUG6_9EURO|nr:uncharacterized protein PV07_12570 [Cladophialophora immunda]KIW22030.1 hypothetical protein PV07_12570 [Cladophialophora immunda]
MITLFVQIFLLLAAAYGFYPPEKLFLPASFNARPRLGGYENRPQYWDLDADPDRPDPILLKLEIGSSSVKIYYLPPKSSHHKIVCVCYHGHLRAVGALYNEFWSMLGDVPKFIVNLPGYGTIDEDRSPPWSTSEAGTFEKHLEAIPAAIQERIIGQNEIDWTQFEPRTVRNNNGRLEAEPLDPNAMNKLPKTFKDHKPVAFGRSIGTLLATKHEETWAVCLYTPYLGRKKVTGPKFLRWAIKRVLERLPFGESSFDFNKIKDHQSLVIVADGEDLVGELDPEVQEHLNSKKSLYIIKGNHSTLPDEGCGNRVREFIDKLGKE